MEGIERLETEVAELDVDSITKIFNYLKTRKDLYDKFNNPEKSAEEMYDYIYNKSKKHAYKNMAMLDDNVVYMWAVTYFTKSNEELGIKKEKKEEVKTTAPTDVKKESTQEIKKEEKPKDNQMTLFQEVQK